MFFLIMTIFAIPTKRVSKGFNIGGSLLTKVVMFLLNSVNTYVTFSARSFLMFEVVRNTNITFLGMSTVTVMIRTIGPRGEKGTLNFAMAKICLTASLSPMVYKFLIRGLK